MNKDSEVQTPIRLADFITGVREELAIASQRYQSLAKDKKALVPPLQVKALVLEAAIISSLSGDADGKVSVFVLQGTIKGSTSHQSSQKVTIQLAVDEFNLGND